MQDNVDRHFYLYAKGHYRVEDFILDLIQIQSYRTSVPTDSLTVNDVCVTVLDLAYSHMGNKNSFMLFLQRTHNAMREDKLDFISASVSAAMILLALAKVSDIPFELGVADKEVLPLSEEVKS